MKYLTLFTVALALVSVLYTPINVIGWKNTYPIDDPIINTASNFLKNYFPDLYNYIENRDIGPHIDIVTKEKTYSRYIVTWISMDIEVSISIALFNNKYYIERLRAIAGKKGNITEIGFKLINSIMEKADAYLNNVVRKLKNKGFGVVGGKEYKTAHNSYVTYVSYDIYYSNIPLYIYIDSDIQHIRCSIEKFRITERNTIYGVDLDAEASILLDIIEEKGFLQMNWSIPVNRVSLIVKDIIYRDERLTDLRDRDLEIEQHTKKVYIVTGEGIIPGYIVDINVITSNKNIRLYTIIGGITGNVLVYHVFYGEDTVHNEPAGLNHLMWYLISVLILLVVATIVWIIVEKTRT